MASTEKLLTDELKALRVAYHEAAQNEATTVKQLEEIDVQIKQKMKDLREYLAHDALACNNPVGDKECGTTPIGMKRRAGLYEVGCPACPALAQGEDAEEALDNWNKLVLERGEREAQSISSQDVGRVEDVLG